MLFGVHARSRTRGDWWPDLRGDGPLPVRRRPRRRGTSDEAEAAKDEEGNPVPNGQRNIWINETALATALNVSYMAEQLALFGIIVGIALVLTGIGLILLAYAVFVRGTSQEPQSA